MLHVSALFEPSSRHKLQEILFFSFVLQFLSYCIGDPFCITNHNYCLYGVRCGDRGSTVVKVLCYKSEGRWFDPSWCQWIFH